MRLICKAKDFQKVEEVELNFICKCQQSQLSLIVLNHINNFRTNIFEKFTCWKLKLKKHHNDMNFCFKWIIRLVFLHVLEVLWNFIFSFFIFIWVKFIFFFDSWKFSFCSLCHSFFVVLTVIHRLRFIVIFKIWLLRKRFGRTTAKTLKSSFLWNVFKFNFIFFISLLLLILWIFFFLFFGVGKNTFISCLKYSVISPLRIIFSS